ncbi:MAG: right-handed parallel beta-helix repeat-containing protein [Candidatus Aminicenantes bacterium]|jgi:parallel beta-helix repeat protein
MKFLRIILIGILCVGTAGFLKSSDRIQYHLEIDKQKLAHLIDSYETKLLIGKHFDGQPNIDFDTDTLAFDEFRTNVIVATVDFEHVPSGEHGTASFAYRWRNMAYELIHSSHWLWGTEVSGTLYADTTWNPSGSPYYVTDYTVVSSGVTLTIEPGTVVRVRKSTNDDAVEIDILGILNCQNATITTSCDFENYDNSQIQYNEVDWLGIYLKGNGVCTIEDSTIEYAAYGIYLNCTGDCLISGNTLRRCQYATMMQPSSATHTIENNDIQDCYHGVHCDNRPTATFITGNTITCGSNWNGYTGIYCYESSPTVTSNMISGFDYGIRCRYSSSPVVSSNTLTNNNYGIRCYYGSSPVIHNNNIEGNTYGLHNNDNLVMIDAEDNWWGDATGPYNYSSNPGGLGDSVSDYVDFEPWLTSQVLMALSSFLY